MRRIFLHGLGQTPESWAEIIVRSGSAGHSVCPSLSELLQGQEAAYQNLYEAVSALCGQSDEEPDLCGLSLGAVLALHYAIEHPQKVRSLVLIAPQYRMPRNLLRFQNLLFRWMPKGAFRSTGFEKRAFLRLCETMMDLDFGSSLSKVTCPALILCGERDAVNKKAAAGLAGILKNAELREIAGAGHEVNRDAPRKLSDVLCGFYRRME